MLPQRLPLAALLALSLTTATEAAVIRLRATAAARGTVVRLADVAEITQAEPAEVTTLGEILLAPAPGPGNQIHLDLAGIRSRMAAQGVNFARTELSGSNVVVVSSSEEGAVNPMLRAANEKTAVSQQQRAEKQVADAVARHLQRVAPDLGRMQVSVTVDRKDAAALLAGAITGYEILGAAPPWNGPQRLTIRTLDKSNAIRESTIEARILPHPYVLAVKQTVAKGQVLQPADLVWRQSDSTDGAFLKSEDLVGREAQRTIRPDEIVRQQDVRAVPLVRTNDIVTATARVGGILVKRQMKARNDGAPGETITLVALTGRESVNARVTGYHEAEVIPAGGTASEVRDETGQIRFEPAPAAASPARVPAPRVVTGIPQTARR